MCVFIMMLFENFLYMILLYFVRSHAFVLFEKGTDIDWVMSKYNRSSLHQHIMTISLIKKEITLETPHQPKSSLSVQPKTNADKICVNTRDRNAKVNRINGVDDDHDDSLERVIGALYS